MSRRVIERALRTKGLRWTELTYDREATPHGMMAGWTVKLTDDVEEELAADGFDTEPDAENSREVLDWIETLPDLRAFPAAPAPDPAIPADTQSREGEKP